MSPYCQPRPCACLRGIACCQFYSCALGRRRRGGDVGVAKQSTLHPGWWCPARNRPRRVRFQNSWEAAVKSGALPNRSLSPPANKQANDGGKGILNGGCAVLHCPRGWLLGSTPKAFTQRAAGSSKKGDSITNPPSFFKASVATLPFSATFHPTGRPHSLPCPPAGGRGGDGGGRCSGAGGGGPPPCRSRLARVPRLARLSDSGGRPPPVPLPTGPPPSFRLPPR